MGEAAPGAAEAEVEVEVAAAHCSASSLSSALGPSFQSATVPGVRALVVSNMLPDPAHPERGSFVRDQVAALRAIEGLDVDLFEFAPGSRSLARAPLQGRRRFGHRRGSLDWKP